jgi:hypothetical protein
MDRQTQSRPTRALVSDLLSGYVRTNLPRAAGADDRCSLSESTTYVAEKQAWGDRWNLTVMRRR